MNLLTKIDAKSAQIGVLGLGYVGLPLVIEFCRAGFNVCGFDLDETKVNLLNAGKSYIRHIDLSAVQNELKGKFTATTDFSKLANMDCIIVCVPTPLNKNREIGRAHV